MISLDGVDLLKTYILIESTFIVNCYLVINCKIPVIIKHKTDTIWSILSVLFKENPRDVHNDGRLSFSRATEHRVDAMADRWPTIVTHYTQREERKRERGDTPPPRVFGSICPLDAQASTFWRLPLERPCVTPLFPCHAYDAVAQMHASPLARVLGRSRRTYRHFPVILIDHLACSLRVGPPSIARLPFSGEFSLLCTLSTFSSYSWLSLPEPLLRTSDSLFSLIWSPVLVPVISTLNFNSEKSGNF